jgi:hypothetical protein
MENKIDHARILNAYLMRMTVSDMQAIQEQHQKWVNACFKSDNISISEPMQCRAGFYALVANAICNLIPHDINYINQVINEETSEITQ